MGHHREHQWHEIVGIPMKSGGEESLRATTRIPRFPQGAGFFVPIAFPSTPLPRIVSADDGFMISRIMVRSMIDVEPVIIQMGIAFWVHFELSL